MADPAARLVPDWRGWSGTIRTLTWRDRALAVEAFALLVLAAPLVRLFGIRRLTERLARVRNQPMMRRAPRDLERAQSIARIVAMSARHTPNDTTCLHRSLALWWLLGRRGFPADFVVGARKENGTLEAHAWVEFRKTALNDDPAVVGHYVILSRTRRG